MHITIFLSPELHFQIVCFFHPTVQKNIFQFQMIQNQEKLQIFTFKKLETANAWYFYKENNLQNCCKLIFNWLMKQ